MSAEKILLTEHYIVYPKSYGIGKAVRHIFSYGKDIAFSDREAFIIDNMRCAPSYDYCKLDKVGVAVDRKGVFVIILQNMERKTALSREFFKVKYFHFDFSCFLYNHTM